MLRVGLINWSIGHVPDLIEYILLIFIKIYIVVLRKKNRDQLYFEYKIKKFNFLFVLI